MIESRSELKARLKQDGRWDKYLSLRDGYKLKGLPPKDANRKALDDIKDETTDQDNAVADDNNSFLHKQSFSSTGKTSARKIVEWIFNNIGIEDVKPEDAPSSGAWCYMQSLRSSPTLLQDFYRNVWTKMLPSKSEIEAREKHDDDGRELVEFIDRIKRCGGRNE